MQRYRYITTNFKPEEQICNFQLIRFQNLNLSKMYIGKVIYRVKLPEDLELFECYCCGKYSYSFTKDTRTIKEIGYDIMVVMWNGKLKTVPKDTNLENFKDKQVKKWIIEVLCRDTIH